jgi:hypothetical protein
MDNSSLPAGDDSTPSLRPFAGRGVRILLVALLVAAVLGLSLFAGGYFLFYRIFGLRASALRMSVPYRMAMERLGKDRQVIESLGEPIRGITWMPSGSLSWRGDSGEARIDFDIAGPKGLGHVHVEARTINGRWHLIVLRFTPAGGQALSLDTASAAGTGEAPKWASPAANAGKPPGAAENKAASGPAAAGEQLNLPSGTEIHLPQVPR